MIDEILNAYGARFVIAAGGVFLALVVLIAVLWIIRNKAPSPFVRGGRSRQPRLQVLDATAVDTRRRLVLVRRDNIEHLILIGGPTDIVVESGIGEPKAYLAGELAANAALAEHRANEAFPAQQDHAALQASAPDLRSDAPMPRDRLKPVREEQKKAPALELVMPTEPAAPQKPLRQDPPIAKTPARTAPAPEIVPETVSAPRPQSAAPPVSTPAPVVAPSSVPARAPVVQAPAASIDVAAEPAKAPEPAKPSPPVKTPEPLRAEAPEVVVAPAPVPNQAPPAVRMEDATLALDAARERVLAPKVEPFAAERFKPPVEPVEIPTPVEATPRVDPDMESIKSEFEKILDADVLAQPAPRPRPTVEPPVARSIPAMDVSAIAKPQMAPAVHATSGPENRTEGNLQNEIARIFGEMGEPRKD